MLRRGREELRLVGLLLFHWRRCVEEVPPHERRLLTAILPSLRLHVHLALRVLSNLVHRGMAFDGSSLLRAVRVAKGRSFLLHILRIGMGHLPRQVLLG